MKFLPFDDAVTSHGAVVAIPIDVSVANDPDKSWKVSFNATELTLWNRLPRPDGGEWIALPNESAPAWYQHTSGTLVPAWNLFANCLDLLTAGEERRIPDRDLHGRFAHTSSPRYAAGLLEVPAVNEAIALLVAAAQYHQDSSLSLWTLAENVKAPTVVFSHDCDILAGNDAWTQAVRLMRVIQPLTRLRLPGVANLRWLASNYLNPYRYYFDNATGMQDLEQVFNACTTFYLLNGTGGRFGARNNFRENIRLIAQLRPPSEIGIHYNYDTFLNEKLFQKQLDQLQEAVPQPIRSGRAHYLRFDSQRSYRFLERFGIEVDESSGWSTTIGYRNGLAGCFQAFDTNTNSPLNIWEVPLVMMEDALVRQYHDEAVAVFDRHLLHLSRIGGALTFLIHPGQFNNPEHPSTHGLYHKLLMTCRSHGARFSTARELAQLNRS